MIRRTLFWLLVIAFLWIVITRLTEIQSLAETLAQGQWQWVLAAFWLQLLYYTLVAASYQAAFKAVGVNSRVLHLIPITFASIFVGVAAPSIGASAAALFVDDAAQRGQSATRTAVGSLLYLIANLAAFFVVLVVGMIYLFVQDNLRSYQVIAALTLVFFMALMVGVLLLGLWRPALLRRLLAWIQRTLNGALARFRRPPALKEDWAEGTASEFSEAAAAIAQRPAGLRNTVLLALLSHLVDIASLLALFWAFNQPVGTGVLVAAYAMGILFWIVTIVPHGIGVVEGVMTLVIASLGVPADRAAVITLAFRGLSFWLPFAIGFFMLRRLRAFKITQA
jgi:uncharacterized protein (TIRG00374 family)